MLTAEFARVLRRWNPGGVGRLEEELANPTRAARVAVYARPGLDGEAVLSLAVSAEPGGSIPSQLQRCEPAMATVLLVVLEADVPPGRAVLAELRTLPEAVHVVVALAGQVGGEAVVGGEAGAGGEAVVGGEAGAGGEAVVARTRELLSRYVPALADAPLHVLPGDLDSLRRDFADALTDENWPRRSLAVTLHRTLTDARRALSAAGAGPGGADLDAARRARANLLTGRDGSRGDRVAAVRASTAVLRVEVTHEIGATVRDLAADSALVTGEHLREHLAVAATRLGSRLDVAVDDLTERSGLDRPARPRAVDASPSLPMLEPPPAPRYTPAGDEWLAAILGLSAGAGVGRVVASVLAVGTTGVVIATVVGAMVIAATTVALRLRAGRRGRRRRWVNDVLVDARSRWEQAALSTLLTAEADLVDALTSAARFEIARIDAEIARIDERIRVLSADGLGRGAALERDLAALERGADALRIAAAGHVAPPLADRVEVEPRERAVRQT